MTICIVTSSGIPNVIIHAKFHVDHLRGFCAAGPPKVPFPILIATTLTTVLYYRADCEVMWQLIVLFVTGIARMAIDYVIQSHSQQV